LRQRPEASLALGSRAAGSALLDGWSDEGPWQIVLPWPEETIARPWDAAGEWKSVLRELEDDLDDEPSPLCPFSGGWVGFISYEAMACEEEVMPRGVHPPEPPVFFARHRAGIVVRPDGEAFLFAPEGTEDRYLQALAVERRSIGRVEVPEEVQDSLGEGLYELLVQRIRGAIRDGDVYQVNLTRAFSAATRCEPVDLYRILTGTRPPRSSAMIVGDGWSIVSASPEMLLHLDRHAGIAESRPIKGTIRREGGDDAAEIASLLRSGKDAAEHLMIVDVVRNDFGKIAPPGRVSVPEFRSVRTLESVHHLESTVRAEGLVAVPIVDVLGALSPAASITGAPKRAAVQMIREVEPIPRGVYCGSIGILSGPIATFSVAIRTAVVTAEAVRYHAGGGIVWDSDADAENDECFAKASAFLRYARGIS